VIEYRFRRADGTWGWTRDEQVVVYGPDGHPIEVVGSLLDITDRKLSEQRTARLLELSAALAAAVTPAQVAAAALAPAQAVSGANGTALILREQDGLAVAGAVGYPEHVITAWRSFPSGADTPAGRAIVTGTPVYVRSEAEAREQFPAMFGAAGHSLGQGSWAAVPLRVGGEVVGAFAAGFAGRRAFPPEERSFLETVAAQCSLALERARLYETAAAERERLQFVLERLPAGVFIAEAPSGRLISGNAEAERIWRGFVPAERLEEYGAYRGRHPDGRPVRPEEWPLARTIATGEVVTDEEFDITRGDGSTGTILASSAPIREPDGTIVGGICTLLDITDREEARRRLATAYAAEQRARVRLDLLQAVTAGLSEAVSAEQVGAVVVGGGTAVLGCDAAWMGVLDEEGENIVVLATSARLDPAGPAVRVPMSSSLPGPDVMRGGRPIWIESGEDAERTYPGLTALRGGHVGPMCLVPLRSRTGPIGVLALSFHTPRDLTEEDRALVVTLADQGAIALERARAHEREHAVALTLQHSMLPSALPSVPGLDVAARYSPAVSSLEVGGDWYDVLALPDGRVGVTVGDVVGRGLGAAVAMGQLRSALAALALSADDPGAVLDGLDRFARRVDGARLATVVYAVLDPATGELAYACAGHLPPLLVEPGHPPRYLGGGRSPLLCALPAGTPARRAATEVVPPGGTVLLYTDGLVERRGEALDVGLDRLAAAAGGIDLSRPPREWCDTLLDGLLAGGKGDDDVAVLALAYAPVLRRALPARPEQLAGLRRDLRRWLAGVGATDDDVADVLVVAGEACANAVEHAYDGGPGELLVEARLGRGRELTVTVTDRGQWRTVPAPGDRGRGLPLMRALTDSVAVAVGEAGTVVTLRRTLGVAS
jgi:PAS domain S-box-containing protein